ncbi:MAG: signal recognition particle-docking protein FtsY [Methylotetracoccus sp.]
MYRKLAFLAVILALVTVVFAAYVRISTAREGCPDWPGCVGRFIEDEPLLMMQQTADARAFESARPWTKTTHRTMAGALGGVVLALSLMAWRQRENRAKLVALSLTALVSCGLLAWMGLWNPETKSVPLVATAHALLGLFLVSVLYWLYRVARPGGIVRVEGTTMLRSLARLGLLVLIAEIALGNWTSANHAGIVCPDFPSCLGSSWPDAAYRDGFDLLRGFSEDTATAVPALASRVAIHWMHRVVGLLSFLVLSLAAVNISGNRRAAPLSKAGVLLSSLLLLEICLGMGAVMFRLPVAIAVAHSAVAALLLLNVVHINLSLRRSGSIASNGAPIPVAVPRPTGTPLEPARPTPAGVVDRLRTQLGKTRGGLSGAIASLALGRKTIDREVLDQIEEQLLIADLGVGTTAAITRDLAASLERRELADWDVVNQRLREHLHAILRPCSVPLEIPDDVRPFVILVVGVNGVGKTTTIGKLARRLQDRGLSVMLAAGDTFRAAAVEQLQTWGERNGIPVIAQQSGADSASVIFDAVQAAQARKVDVLIADTAGRLHTKSNLMEELSKIKRIVGRLDSSAPHEVLLVVDAGTGQNAISQARQFNEAVGLTGLALTKLDGTAKGGVIFALADQFGIPIRFIGIGEGIEDLQDFDADKFIAALFETRLH